MHRAETPRLALLCSFLLVAGGANALVSEQPVSVSARQIVDNYLFFGADAQVPLNHNCSKWATFYASNGTSCAPGSPCAYGTSELAELCDNILKSFILGPLFSVQQISPIFDSVDQHTVASVAFQWTLTSTMLDGSLNVAPAISTIALDAEGKFTLTQDYFAPQPAGPGGLCPAGSQLNGKYCTALVGSCRGPGGLADLVNFKWRTDQSSKEACEGYCDAQPSCVGYSFNGAQPYCILYGPGMAQGALPPLTGAAHDTTTISGASGNSSYVCVAKVDQGIAPAALSGAAAPE